MNCAHCGSALPPNVSFCPVCNEPVLSQTQRYQPYVAQPMQPQDYPPMADQTRRYQPVGAAGQPQGYPPPPHRARFGRGTEGAQGQYAPQNPYAQGVPVAPQDMQPPLQPNMPQGQYAPVAPPNPYAQGIPVAPQDMQPPLQPNMPQNPYTQAAPVAPPSGFPAGYQQPYQYGRFEQPSRLLSAVKPFPRAFVACFRSPAEPLKQMLDSRDWISGLVVTGAALLMAFLCGMVVTRGAMTALARSFGGSLSGLEYLFASASSQSAVSAATGSLAVSVGGIASLCQLLSMLIPSGVALAYCCAVCRARFSWELAAGFVAVTTLPTVALSLLMILSSLLSPYLPLPLLLCGVAVGYAQLGALMAFVTGRAEQQLFPAKLVCYCVSLLVTLLMLWLVGGSLVGEAFRQALGASLP